MAKKKFGLSSTLNKNKLEEPVLPKKIPLTKSSKDLKDVKEKVEALHEAAVRVIDKVEEPLIELTLNVEDENIGKIVQVEVVSSNQNSLFGKLKKSYKQKVA